MKTFLYSFLTVCLIGSHGLIAQEDLSSEHREKAEIDTLLNSWHEAAARADSEAYFGKMADPSIFIGTDPTENWNKKEFIEWSEKYFQRDTAWDFTAIERNIFFGQDKRIAWFDELLRTHMGLCRGSGVLVREDGQWKIKHYVLSMTIPNDQVDEVSSRKKKFDQKIISEIK